MRQRIGRSALALALLVSGLAPALASAGVDSPLEIAKGDPETGVGGEPEPDPTDPAALDPLFDEEFGEAFDAIRPPDSDPLEPLNRAFFRFNQFLDGYFWGPVTAPS